jgi:hypothetical protein
VLVSLNEAKSVAFYLTVGVKEESSVTSELKRAELLTLDPFQGCAIETLGKGFHSEMTR